MLKVSFQPYCAPAPTLVWCFWLGSSTSSTTYGSRHSALANQR